MYQRLLFRGEINADAAFSNLGMCFIFFSVQWWPGYYLGEAGSGLWFVSRGRFKSVVKFFENVGIAGSEEAENENVNKSRNGDTLGPVKQMGWSVGCHGVQRVSWRFQEVKGGPLGGFYVVLGGQGVYGVPGGPGGV